MNECTHTVPCWYDAYCWRPFRDINE